jgi:vacuolar-type H+-ATPase subunit C/Vma6
MLEKSKPFTSNITMKESMALKSLKDKTEIRILQADKGNCMVVLKESTYREKISSLLESGVYEILRKDLMSQIERKIQKLLSKHKTVLTTVNHLTSMDFPRCTNLTSHSDQ